MDTVKRPTSVTVIAWILIALYGLFGLIFTPFQFSRPMIQQFLIARGMPLVLAVLVAIASSALFLISGIAMLRGFNWGRLLCIYLMVASLVYDWGVCGFRPAIFIHVIIYIVIFTFLTRPATMAFFKGRAPDKSKAGE